jgi:GTPase involved in cell partitioning and DNA repair
LFPHHIEEWKQQFISVIDQSARNQKQVTVKTLRNEIKELNKDLNRKNKALAETAALLVLQKKVNTIWGNSEANLQ